MNYAWLSRGAGTGARGCEVSGNVRNDDDFFFVAVGSPTCWTVDQPPPGPVGRSFVARKLLSTEHDMNGQGRAGQGRNVRP
jgi:hypothetical protein